MATSAGLALNAIAKRDSSRNSRMQRMSLSRNTSLLAVVETRRHETLLPIRYAGSISFTMGTVRTSSAASRFRVSGLTAPNTPSGSGIAAINS